jgi:hypothetical protein
MLLLLLALFLLPILSALAGPIVEAARADDAMHAR